MKLKHELKYLKIKQTLFYFTIYTHTISSIDILYSIMSVLSMYPSVQYRSVVIVTEGIVELTINCSYNLLFVY